MTSTVTYEIADKIAIISPDDEPGVRWPGCQHVKRNLAARDPLPLLFITAAKAKANPAWDHAPCRGWDGRLC